MKRLAGCAFALAFLALFAPAQVEAQWIWFGGGGSFAVSDYADYANTGVLFTAGVAVPMGQEGLSLFGEIFAGQNGHSDYEGDKTNPYGFMGGVQLDLGQEGQGGAYFFGEAGWMFHKYSSDVFDGDNESALGYGAGAGYWFPLGSVNGWAEVRAMNANIDGSKTSFVGVLAGVSIPVGSN
jgi:hypothetical protein